MLFRLTAKKKHFSQSKHRLANGLFEYYALHSTTLFPHSVLVNNTEQYLTGTLLADDAEAVGSYLCVAARMTTMRSKIKPTTPAPMKIYIICSDRLNPPGMKNKENSSHVWPRFLMFALLHLTQKLHF